MEMIAPFARFFHVSIDHSFGMTPPDQSRYLEIQPSGSPNARSFLRCSGRRTLWRLSASVLPAPPQQSFSRISVPIVMACSPEPEILPDKLMADHLNRALGRFEMPWRCSPAMQSESCSTELDEYARADSGCRLSTSTKPAKGGERHGAVKRGDSYKITAPCGYDISARSASTPHGRRRSGCDSPSDCEARAPEGIIRGAGKPGTT